MSDVGDQMAMHNNPRFVIGNFNVTSRSSHFQLLTKRAGLRDSRNGFGIQPTWPAFRFHPLQICLDHCLVSEEFIVRNRTRGPQIGSDHYPILVDLALRSPEN